MVERFDPFPQVDELEEEGRVHVHPRVVAPESSGIEHGRLGVFSTPSGRIGGETSPQCSTCPPKKS